MKGKIYKNKLNHHLTPPNDHLTLPNDQLNT